MRIGVTLPQFEDTAVPALDAAVRAEQLGFDGVFCFDHLWPMGRPDRPALSSGPLLGALAASTRRVTVGTLVARVGLLPDALLVGVLSSIATLSGGRLIAGLGTGDHLSQAENEAYGIPYEPAEQRRARVVTVGTALRARGIPVWVGGGLPKTVALARPLGAAVNLWGGDPRTVSELTATGTEVTWAGPVGESMGEAQATLAALAAAGATWAVCAWPDSLEMVAEAARSAH